MSGIILCMFSVQLQAQQGKGTSMNSLRTGVGINICNTDYLEKTTSAGPSIFADYSRKINGWFSAGANLHYDLGIYDRISLGNRIGLSLRGMFRPFATVNWMKWLEVGAGLSCEYVFTAYGDRDSRQTSETDGVVTEYYDLIHRHSCLFGFDFPIRAYFIDNSKFEVLAFYELKTAFYKGAGFGLDHSCLGLMFGVKF